MRVVLLFPFPLNVIATLLLVPTLLVCGAAEGADAARLRRGGGYFEEAAWSH